MIAAACPSDSFGARYEKLAIHYLALVQISMIRLLVRRVERHMRAVGTVPRSSAIESIDTAINCF